MRTIVVLVVLVLLAPSAGAAKGGKGGGSEPSAATVAPDPAFASTSDQLASSCPGSVVGGWSIAFGHSGCLVVEPDGSSYDLTDDLTIEVTARKGAIVALKVRGQDVIGPDGVMHETDAIVVEPPVVPDPAGFTLHLHADDIDVWRLSGHLRGKRVERIGTIAIGDVVYATS